VIITCVPIITWWAGSDLGYVVGLVLGMLFFVPVFGIAIGAGLGRCWARWPSPGSMRSSRIRSGGMGMVLKTSLS
jgi:hypothetical protein